jgi:hypothetical protein
MSPINITRDAIRMTSDGVFHVAKQAVKGVNHLVEDTPLTMRNETSEVSFAQEISQTTLSTESSTGAATIESIKHVVCETKVNLSKKVRNNWVYFIFINYFSKGNTC